MDWYKVVDLRDGSLLGYYKTDSIEAALDAAAKAAGHLDYEEAGWDHGGNVVVTMAEVDRCFAVLLTLEELDLVVEALGAHLLNCSDVVTSHLIGERLKRLRASQ